MVGEVIVAKRNKRSIREPAPIAPGEQAKPARGDWPDAPDLPEPRLDGKCVYCEKEAVTRDGRFCNKHLKELIVRMNPGSIVPRGINRTAEQRQSQFDDAGSVGENCVRIMEGD
jgi:hypothetical protein